MSTYREIHGKAIKSLSTDPSAETDAGQIWYNTTSDTFKSIVASQAWISSSNMITARSKAGGTTSSNSTQSAGMAFGGQIGGATSALNEEYNGSGWSTGGALNTARRWHYGAGSQTAALCAGGQDGTAGATPVTANSEEYNGTSWAEGSNMGTARYNGGSGGTQTAAFATGGSPAPSYTNATEEYGGTSWTAGNNMLVSKGYYGGGGTLTAGIVMGIGASGTDSYEYDGTNWTTGGTMNRGNPQGSYAGLQTDGIAFGGSPTPVNATEHYNGTAWTNYPSMATARYALAGASGTSSAAMGAGGYTPPDKNTTEEFTSSTNAITAAAWSTGGNLPTPISSCVGGGTKTAGLQMSGQPSGPGVAATTAVNEYDGSAWTAGGAIAPGAASYGGQASKNGTQTAMLYFKGHYAGNKNTVSSYDGSSWTAQSTFPNTDVYGGGCGTLTAALSAGGYAPSPPYVQATCFESDASYNWTTGGSLGTARYINDVVGLQTNAVTAGGLAPSPLAKTEEYNGTAWSEKSDMISNTGGTKSQCFGTNSDDMMVAGGPPNLATCIGWDGSAWSTRPSISTGRHGGAGAGTSSTSGWIGGGQSPFKTATEEFSGETTAINVKTLTQS